MKNYIERVEKTQRIRVDEHGLLECMKQTGVTKCVLIATRSRMGLEAPNSWVAEMSNKYKGKFVGLASLDPFDPLSPQKIVRLCRCENFKGIKLRPGYDFFYPNDVAIYSLYEKLEDLKAVVLFHSGFGFRTARLKYDNPLYLDDVAIDFPKLNVIIAHMAHGFSEIATALAAKHPNVFLDLSGLRPRELLNLLYQALTTIEPEKILFGSDWPCEASSMRETVETIKNCDFLSTRDRRYILSENARRLFFNT